MHMQPEAKPLLIVLCGLPGSGKSTWAARNYPEVTPCSSDTVRELLFESQSILGGSEVFDFQEKWVVERLRTQQPTTIVDSTNLKLEHRANWMHIARNFGAQTCLVWVNTPLNECKARNQNRTHVVPPEVINRMASTMDIPTREEGWGIFLKV